MTASCAACADHGIPEGTEYNKSETQTNHGVSVRTKQVTIIGQDQSFKKIEPWAMQFYLAISLHPKLKMYSAYY